MNITCNHTKGGLGVPECGDPAAVLIVISELNPSSLYKSWFVEAACVEHAADTIHEWTDAVRNDEFAVIDLVANACLEAVKDKVKYAGITPNGDIKRLIETTRTTVLGPKKVAS